MSYRRPFLVSLFAGTALLVGTLFPKPEGRPLPAETATLPVHQTLAVPAHIHNQLQAGDILFRGKDKSWGDLGAQLSDRDKRFGHVGIIVTTTQGFAVIDAIGNPLEPEGSVRQRTLAKFFARATRAAIYRPQLRAQTQRQYLDIIYEHAAAQTPFDRHYDLSNARALYCTELVWFALKTATGTDQIPEQTLLRGRRVIAIDDLQYAPIMQRIWDPGRDQKHAHITQKPGP